MVCGPRGNHCTHYTVRRYMSTIEWDLTSRGPVLDVGVHSESIPHMGIYSCGDVIHDLGIPMLMDVVHHYQQQHVIAIVHSRRRLLDVR